VGDYLATPHVHFDLIKRHFPQYMAGRDKRGIPVYYESTARIDAKMLKASGIGVNQLLWHQVRRGGGRGGAQQTSQTQTGRQAGAVRGLVSD
jgi:hypothetical protein